MRRELVAQKFMATDRRLASAVNDHGETPLHVAAERNLPNIIEVLLASGADANARDRLGNTPLHSAISGGGVVFALSSPVSGTLSSGDRPKVDALNQVVRLLLAKGADVNASDNDGETPLFWVAARGHKAVGELLLTRGADVTATDKAGRTPLHQAAENGHNEIVRILLAKGADPNARTKIGLTPLHGAVATGEGETLKLLISSGGDLHIGDKNQRTPLHWAAAFGMRDMVNVLLASGAQLEAKDGEGATALHWAARQGRKDVVGLLLTSGANANAEDRTKKTVVDFAGLPPVEISLSSGPFAGTQSMSYIPQATQQERKETLEMLRLARGKSR